MATIVTNGETTGMSDVPPEYGVKYKAPMKSKEAAMKIDLQNPPKYLKQTTTGRIYPFSIFKANRDDMEPYEMPAPLSEEKTAALDTMIDAAIALNELEDDAAEIVFDRLEIIKAAIAQIPVEAYGKSIGNKPALPKVKDVSDLAGFKVTAAEILGIIKG